MIYTKLNPEKAMIWRIVHRDNLPWLLENGLHCGNSNKKSSNWVAIGHQELIKKRAGHTVPILPKGTLNDYVPFYFTPFSIMLYNILTGRGGVKKYSKEEIIILVSSLNRIKEFNLPFVFTNKHAYFQYAEFYSKLDELDKIDWSILQNRDFKRDPDDLEKFERYQAEALIYKNCPIQALLGIICYSQNQVAKTEKMIKTYNLDLSVHLRPAWYF